MTAHVKVGAHGVGAEGHDLLGELDAARARLNAGLDLIDRSFELREQLQWQLDLDHMRDQVSALKRAVAAHRNSH